MCVCFFLEIVVTDRVVLTCMWHGKLVHPWPARSTHVKQNSQVYSLQPLPRPLPARDEALSLSLSLSLYHPLCNVMRELFSIFVVCAVW